jgi:hypothetical protein
MELVRTLEDLPTIKISLSFGGAGHDRYSPAVDFEVGAGAEVLHRFTVDPAALGIPRGFDPGSYRQAEPGFSLADDVRSQLTEPAYTALDGGRTLWLQLASPIGYLAALPWERMLEADFPYLSILRIPDFTLVPERGEGPIDIVLCISEPDSEPQPAAWPLVSALAEADLPGATVHVFTDLPTHDLLSGRWAGSPGVVLHDPRLAGEASAGPVTDPWLAWLVREMRGTTVEAVHFAAHGYLAGEQPALAMSDSPTAHDERVWARFISPDQLAECLTQLGAWSVGFTSLPGNFSPLGLREFADSVARLRPGPVFYQQPVNLADHDLDQVYADLFAGEQPRLYPGSFLYVHPRMMGVSGPPAYAESLVAETLGRQAPRAVPPPWETATRRFLEQSTAQRFPDQAGPASAEQEAVGEGVRQALAFVSEILNEHGGQQG